MDNSAIELLTERLAALGLPPELAGGLWDYAQLLLRWNERVNLTAITSPREVIDKHLIDSLAVLPEVPPMAHTAVDVGAGAGLPGIPWALARPALSVTLVDAVQKKVAFMKAAIAGLGLSPRVKAVHLRATGSADGLGRFDVVVSRAFMDVDRWLPLAAQYVTPTGVVLAMVGQAPDPLLVQRAATQAGLELVSERRFALPLSLDPRGVLCLRPRS